MTSCPSPLPRPLTMRWHLLSLTAVRPSSTPTAPRFWSQRALVARHRQKSGAMVCDPLLHCVLTVLQHPPSALRSRRVRERRNARGVCCGTPPHCSSTHRRTPPHLASTHHACNHSPNRIIDAIPRYLTFVSNSCTGAHITLQRRAHTPSGPRPMRPGAPPTPPAPQVAMPVVTNPLDFEKLVGLLKVGGYNELLDCGLEAKPEGELALLHKYMVEFFFTSPEVRGDTHPVTQSLTIHLPTRPRPRPHRPARHLLVYAPMRAHQTPPVHPRTRTRTHAHIHPPIGAHLLAHPCTPPQDGSAPVKTEMAAPTGWSYDTVMDKLCALEDVRRTDFAGPNGGGDAPARRRASVEAARASETVDDFHAFMKTLKDSASPTGNGDAAGASEEAGAAIGSVESASASAHGVGNGVAEVPPVGKAHSDEDDGPLPPVPHPAEHDASADAGTPAVVMRNAVPANGERRNSMDRPARPSARPNRPPSIESPDSDASAPSRPRVDSVPMRPGRPPSGLPLSAKPAVGPSGAAPVGLRPGPPRPGRPKSVVVPPRSPAMARRVADMVAAASPGSSRKAPSPTPTVPANRPSPTPGRLAVGAANPSFGMASSAATSQLAPKLMPKTPPPKRKPVVAPPSKSSKDAHAPPPKPASPAKPKLSAALTTTTKPMGAAAVEVAHADVHAGAPTPPHSTHTTDRTPPPPAHSHLTQCSATYPPSTILSMSTHLACGCLCTRPQHPALSHLTCTHVSEL
jgi:hypothetical protein